MNLIHQRLQTLTQGLTYMSESDYPYEVVDTDDLMQVQDILNLLLDEEDEVEQQEVADFFQSLTTVYEGMGEEEMTLVRKNVALRDYVLEVCGENCYVARLGTGVEKTIYLIGKTDGNRFIILKTKSVET